MVSPHFRYRVNGCLEVGLQFEVLAVGFSNSTICLVAGVALTWFSAEDSRHCFLVAVVS
jgi:hypothetical protein